MSRYGSNKKTNQVIEFGGFTVIDGKNYRHALHDIGKGILCVEPTELNEHPEEIEWSSDFICPYCGHEDPDAFELSDLGETECSACGSELEYEREYTVEYNIKPIKCAPVTKA
ncbi:hypothetical protein [Oceanobacillus oncorhynchi]|uniref:hypothetical protein n=1 Tax=Oceanobacillus oncorhynchi TaxID=545501 RepID=UPI0018675F91|nr:hypothetical protein [Oceanobacillus oncorhynchi]